MITNILSQALTLLAWLIALLWLWKAITTAFGLRHVPDITESQHNLTPLGNPSITVIVPARNESSKVAACLQSLIDQQHPSLHIIAVDDRSTDTTGAIMNTLALQHPGQLNVLHITELPTGWLGKTHAMASAARHAIAIHKPDYLLFTDGDVLFRPDALRLALAHAVATRADHLTVLPTTLHESASESMLLAYLHVLGLLAVRPWRVSDPKALRDAIGIGAFNLVRTAVYQQIGGFDALRMEVVEDLTFGRNIKRAGLHQRYAVAPGLIRIHWASGIAGIVNGVTKNFFAVFRYRVAFLLLASMWMTILCIVPVTFLCFAQTRTPAILTVIAVAALYALSCRQTRISPWYAILLPVSAVVILFSIFRSMFITLWNGGVTWRGPFYPLAELRKSTPPPA